MWFRSCGGREEKNRVMYLPCMSLVDPDLTPCNTYIPGIIPEPGESLEHGSYAS